MVRLQELPKKTGFSLRSPKKLSPVHVLYNKNHPSTNFALAQIAQISNPTNHMYSITSPVVYYCVGWNYEKSTEHCTMLPFFGFGGETVHNIGFASGLIGCPTG